MFIGGGNTFRLLRGLKTSGAFDRIKSFTERDGVVFGGSAGAIIFGKDLSACTLDDANDTDFRDTSGFDVLGGISLLCHYTNRTEEQDSRSTDHLIRLSARTPSIALPEEDTIFINGDSADVIGTRPYYRFENGRRRECQPGMMLL
jgi:dipeptidase E